MQQASQCMQQASLCLTPCSIQSLIDYFSHVPNFHFPFLLRQPKLPHAVPARSRAEEPVQSLRRPIHVRGAK